MIVHTVNQVVNISHCVYIMHVFVDDAMTSMTLKQGLWLVRDSKKMLYQPSLLYKTVISLGTPVSSTNKTDNSNIHVTEILLKVVLNTIALTLLYFWLDIIHILGKSSRLTCNSGLTQTLTHIPVVLYIVHVYAK